MARIHHTAIVPDDAELGEDVEVGPGCVLAGRVRLGAGVRLLPGVCLSGPIEIGERTIVYPHACLGFPPQDYKFGPDATTAGVRIGADCIIREHATVHAATSATVPTTVGDCVFMMVSSHAGHDCIVGDRVVMVNFAGLSGHTEVGAGAIISGQAGTHQFVRIGRLAMLSGGVQVSNDVPPFCVAHDRNRISGINRVGMRRAGMDRGEITAVARAFRVALAPPLLRDEAQSLLDELGRDSPAVAEIADFARKTRRGICPGLGRPPRGITAWLRFRRRGGDGTLDVDAID